MHESKFPFVSRIEFIRSKLSNFSAHVYGVCVRASASDPAGAERPDVGDSYGSGSVYDTFDPGLCPGRGSGGGMVWVDRLLMYSPTGGPRRLARDGTSRPTLVRPTPTPFTAQAGSGTIPSHIHRMAASLQTAAFSLNQIMRVTLDGTELMSLASALIYTSVFIKPQQAHHFIIFFFFVFLCTLSTVCLLNLNKRIISYQWKSPFIRMDYVHSSSFRF